MAEGCLGFCFAGSGATSSRSGDEAVEAVGGGCGDLSLGLGCFASAFAPVFPLPISRSPLLLDGFSRSGEEAVEAVDCACGDGDGWDEGSLGPGCFVFAFPPPILPNPLLLDGSPCAFGGGGDGNFFSGRCCCLNFGGVS